MKASGRVLFVVAFTFATMATGASAERTVSTSRQFVVYGGDLALRGAISHLAEETKANLLAFVRRSDAWETPIVVNLQFPQANLPEIPPAALHFSQTGAALKLQLDLTIAADFQSAAVERELLRAILLEMIYRKQSELAPGTAFVEAPAWLLDGILARTPGRNPKLLADALEPVIRAEKTISLSDFLHQQPALLDSFGRSLYRAYALVFVNWLVDQTDGRSILVRYIDNLSRAGTDPLVDLKMHFPALASDAAEKNWKARLAQFGAIQDYELLTFAETEERLQELLTIKVVDSVAHTTKSYQLEDLLTAKISPAQSLALKQLSQDLMLLGFRAHPIVRPAVAEYRAAATLLASGKTPGIKERLARLGSLRTKIAQRMNRIDDYLNWFEATQARTRSGAFSSYLNAVEAQNDAPHRHDPLSVYLDAIEEQFQD
jgi:hypothetical protein